jgi:hypothetical protein
MRVTEQLNELWTLVDRDAAAAAGWYQRRIPSSGDWAAHAAIFKPGRKRALILEADRKMLSKHRFADETKGFVISVAPDDSGRADRSFIRILETEVYNREIFTVFCADLLRHWLPQKDHQKALSELEKQLLRWKKFFQRDLRQGLSREEYIGLFGELSFLEAALRASGDALKIVSSWSGPQGTNQDFLFGPKAVEVKTSTGNDQDTVTVSNARQLDATGLDRLYLAHYVLDFRQGSGRTLQQIVASLRQSVSAMSAEAAAIFEERLVEAGYLDDAVGRFKDWGLTLRAFVPYNVEGNFPRILETAIPHGISDVSYSLNLASADTFRLPDQELWRLLDLSHE